MATILDTVRNNWVMACPECGSDADLDIAASIWVRLVPDGTDADRAHNRDHEWESLSPCRCDLCGWLGTVSDARMAADPDETE